MVEFRRPRKFVVVGQTHPCFLSVLITSIWSQVDGDPTPYIPFVNNRMNGDPLFHASMQSLGIRS